MKKNRLIENIKYYFLGTLAIKIMQFIFIPIYSAYISPDDFGYFNMVVSIVALIVPLLYQSIWEGVLRFVISEKDRENEVLSTATIYCMILTIIYLIIYSIFTTTFKIEYSLFILLMGLSQALASYWQFSSRAMKYNDIYTISTVINSIITIVLNIVLIFIMRKGLVGLFIANTVGNLAMFIILESKLKLLLKLKEYKFNRTLLTMIISYSFPLCINGLSWWLMSSCNSLVISLKLGVNQNGIYSMANRFGTVMSLITSVINMAWQEEAFRIHGEVGSDMYFNKVFKILYKMIFSSIIMLIPITYFAYDFMVFGEYKQGVVYVWIIYLIAGFSAFSSHFASGFLANNDSKIVLTTTLIGGGFSAIAGYLVASIYGVYGVVLTSLIGTIITFILRIMKAKRYIDVKINYIEFVLLFSICILEDFICRSFINSITTRMIIFIVTMLILMIQNRNVIVYIHRMIRGRVKNEIVQ